VQYLKGRTIPASPCWRFLEIALEGALKKPPHEPNHLNFVDCFEFSKDLNKADKLLSEIAAFSGRELQSQEPQAREVVFCYFFATKKVRLNHLMNLKIRCLNLENS